MEDLHPPTQRYYPMRYQGRMLDGNKWPSPDHTFKPNGEPTLSRTNDGLEAVPGYFQQRSVGSGDNKHNVPVFISEFQRRRGVGFDRNRPHVPLTHNFLNNYTNNDIYVSSNYSFGIVQSILQAKHTCGIYI